jgi:hypothetical protein
MGAGDCRGKLERADEAARLGCLPRRVRVLVVQVEGAVVTPNHISGTRNSRGCLWQPWRSFTTQAP